MEYTIKVTVDEDTLKSVSGLDDVHDAIIQEANWMHDSGIFVQSVTKDGDK